MFRAVPLITKHTELKGLRGEVGRLGGTIEVGLGTLTPNLGIGSVEHELESSPLRSDSEDLRVPR